MAIVISWCKALLAWLFYGIKYILLSILCLTFRLSERSTKIFLDPETVAMNICLKFSISRVSLSFSSDDGIDLIAVISKPLNIPTYEVSFSMTLYESYPPQDLPLIFWKSSTCVNINTQCSECQFARRHFIANKSKSIWGSGVPSINLGSLALKM